MDSRAFSCSFGRPSAASTCAKLAPSVNEALADSGAIISSIGVFGNPLEGTPIDLESLQGWKDAIDCAHLFGADMVCGFTGRLRGKSD